MIFLVQSETQASRRRIPIYLVDVDDGVTAKTGVIGATVRISKNGSNQTVAEGSFVETGQGLYYYECSSSDVDTLGSVQINVQHNSTRSYNAHAHVVKSDFYANPLVQVASMSSESISEEAFVDESFPARLFATDTLTAIAARTVSEMLDETALLEEIAQFVWDRTGRTLSAATNITSDGLPIDLTAISVILNAINAKTIQLAFEDGRVLAKIEGNPPSTYVAPITVNDENGNPIDGVEAWVTTDEEGTNVVQKLYTNTFGIANFFLLPGVYWVFAQKSGVNFTGFPMQITVTAT